MLPIYSQVKKIDAPKVVELDGVVGVFMTEKTFRQVTEDREKMFTYYTNWTISESQIVALQLKIDYLNIINTDLKIDIKNLDKTVIEKRRLTSECETKRDENYDLYKKEETKNKIFKILIPVVGIVGLGLGTYLGISIPN